MAFADRLASAKPARKPNLNEFLANLEPADLRLAQEAGRDRAQWTDSALEEFFRNEGASLSIRVVREWRDSL